MSYDLTLYIRCLQTQYQLKKVKIINTISILTWVPELRRGVGGCKAKGWRRVTKQIERILKNERKRNSPHFKCRLSAN